jgi:Archaeal Type IV pilin, N-terminal
VALPLGSRIDGQSTFRSFRSRERTARRSRWRSRTGRRGVSEVVATILILGLTVTLFASIFAFVTTFPAPPAQSVDQFQSSLSYAVSKSGGVYCGPTLLKSGTAGQICGVTILETSGPLVLSNDKVYLTSQNLVTNWQFKAPAGVPVAWGIGNASSEWVTGLAWTTTFSPTITIPDNITVTIVSSTTLLYRVQVSGSSPNEPPVLTSTYITPTNPSPKQGFLIFAVVTGSTSGLSVNVSLGEIPGLSGIGTMKVSKTTPGTYVYVVPNGTTTTNGTYYAFVRGLVSSSGLFPGATISGSVTVTIGGPGSSGGGGTSKPFSVTVGVAPQQPPTPQPNPPVTTQSIYLTATITYTNVSKTPIPIWVNFTVSQTPLGGTKALTSPQYPGQTGLTIVGSGETIVYSQKPYGAWLLDASATVTAALSLGKVGSTSATLSLATPDLIQGELRPTTAGYTSTQAIVPSQIQKGGWAHNCGATCPFLYVQMYDNFTKYVGFSPGVSVYFRGAVYVTGSGGTCSATCNTTYTITNSSSTSITPGSSNTLNVVSDSSSSTTRMSTAAWWARGVSLTITMRIAVYWGATIIAYVYGVAPYPNSALT